MSDQDRHDLYIRMPMGELISPDKDGPVTIYCDRWWLVDSMNRALFYRRLSSPQCNRDRSIVDRVLVRDQPDLRAVFVPWACVPLHIGDYA